MKSPTRTHSATSRVLRTLGGTALLLPVLFLTTSAAGVTDTLRLTGKIRDFQQSHVDFEVVPLGGTGHYAETVVQVLSGDGRPVHADGVGYGVRRQWEDDASHPIAPHTYTDDGTDSCGGEIDDEEGTRGMRDDGGISSVASFNEWFRDLPGINQSTVHAITLNRDGGGVFGYIDDEFHPIDDRLLGNEGQAHNNYFTYHIRADFEYRRCWGQFVETRGGDGVWIFVNGRLVLDLGGVGADDEQYVALDRLGLADGETYTLDLFYAQRRGRESVFHLRTTLELDTEKYVPSVSAMFD